MSNGHQPVGNGAYIIIEPPVANDFEKQVYENGIHSYYRKEQQVLFMVFNINPPVTKSKAQQTPPEGSEGK